eukprot:TRINITY_DN2367_c0_g1_i6.p1 TRINITY_DN2367_c0_g1~~TRINITY_DN2367_c0_g1_i6.p1  ORF type:complete len:396 (-),score=30.63 TRINITY_DN2367_c0_g1_i6:276-1364(-)
MGILVFLIATLAVFCACQLVIPVKDEQNIKFSMGSCNKFYGYEPSMIFEAIREYRPDVFVWTGDVVYADYKVLPGIWRTPKSHKIVAQKFEKAKQDPYYQAFLQTGTPVLGIWDDHDFGINNGGTEFEGKEWMRQQWLDFIDEPLSSPRRTRSGMYESYYLGRKRLVKVILLDNRYNRQKRDTFGEEQWQWLENELSNSPETKVFLLVFGIQFLVEDRYIPETVSPEDRDRLYSIINNHNVSGVILLSGDVHFGEILKLPCSRHRIGYELYEITSSGMTHSVGQQMPQGLTILNINFPDTYNIHTLPLRYVHRNFGTIEFSFNQQDPLIRLQVRAIDGSLALEKVLLLSQLTYTCIISYSKH